MSRRDLEHAATQSKRACWKLPTPLSSNFEIVIVTKLHEALTVKEIPRTVRGSRAWLQKQYTLDHTWHLVLASDLDLDASQSRQLKKRETGAKPQLTLNL